MIRDNNMIPKDIIMCDWHCERMKSYPSIPFFLDKGFRVLPTSFRDVKQTKKLIDFSLAFPSERMPGHLCTIWHAPGGGKDRHVASASRHRQETPEDRALAA
jgi:hypothetical protein